MIYRKIYLKEGSSVVWSARKNMTEFIETRHKSVIGGKVRGQIDMSPIPPVWTGQDRPETVMYPMYPRGSEAQPCSFMVGSNPAR